MKRKMPSSVTSILMRAVLFGIVATAISYLSGGVKYPFGDNVFPPVAAQLVCNFMVYSLTFFAIVIVVKIIIMNKK